MLEKMPAQLYTQSIAMTRLARNVIQVSTLYYSQRKPSELSTFDWIIDAKNENTSNYEQWWSTLIPAFLESAFLKNELIFLKGANYKYFNQYFQSTELPDHLKGIKPNLETGKYVDLKKIMRKNFKFEASNKQIGLQLIDILSNATRRALYGDFSKKCSEALGSLMVKKGKQNINFITLVDKNPKSETIYTKKIIEISSVGKMLIKD
jgi:hypothetical protein